MSLFPSCATALQAQLEPFSWQQGLELACWSLDFCLKCLGQLLNHRSPSLSLWDSLA